MRTVSPLPQYGYLTFIKEMPDVLERKVGKKQKRRRMILCRCKCGVEKVFDFFRVHLGNTKSCGCLQKELMHIEKATHHASRTSEYGIWCAMKERCNNPKHKNHDIYKTVKICDRWQNSFENFIADMGLRPSKKHSIDRFPNKKGDYEQTNCRWATQKQQTRNQSRNIIVEYKGNKVVLVDLCDELELNANIVRHRIRNGWDLESALFAPKQTTYKTLLKSKINL